MAKPTADQQRKLSFDTIRDGLPEGWALIMDTVKARYHTGTFATGCAFVQRIGEVAERLNHHPDINLTYGNVIVSVKSHDVDAITSRDLDLATEISRIAREFHLVGDVSGLSRVDLGLDVHRPSEHLSPFYAALFGSHIRNGESVDPSGQTPTVWWQEQPSAPDIADVDRGNNPALALPPQEHDQRWHFDVWVAPGTGPQRLEAVLGAGGVLVSDAAAPSYWVVEDADGNRHCICTSERSN